MADFRSESRIIITCNRRLSPYLEKEVIDLGFVPERTFQTGLELRGTLTDCIRLNVNLRCASQIHFSLKHFRARNGDDLYDKLLHIPWETILDNETYFSVTCTVNHPTINNELFVNVKVKDAIVDRMRREHGGVRPNSGSEGDKLVIHLFWTEDHAEIFIDTAGETLAKHGYRKIPGKAPMLEALAAATVMATKWDLKSAFVNPMCGSGTVAIEAALLATDRRPGLFRTNYSFMHVLGYDEKVYDQEVQLLKDRIKEVEGLTIIATDISDDAVQIAAVNAGLAGVEHLITFDRCDFAATRIPADPNGVIYFNPEYGERLGEVSELENTYSRIGDFMKKECKGYKGYIFTGNLELAKKIGLKASRRIEFYTAKLDCRLLEYELYAGSRER